MNLPSEKEINKNKKYLYNEISFITICELLEEDKIKIPIEQGVIFKKNVNELVKEYIKDATFFKCKSSICIAVYPNKENYEYYIVDGQHRISMAQEIVKKLEEYNCNEDIFRVNYRYCETMLELKELFESLNKDSKKKLNLPPKISYIRDEAKRTLLNNYSNYFAKKANNISMPHIYSVDEFIHILFDKYQDYITKFESGIELIGEIVKRNMLFNNYVNDRGYRQLLIDIKNPKQKADFYADEHRILKLDSYYTFGFKNNNFIEWLASGTNKNANHITFKFPRRPISKLLREEIWKKEYNLKTSGICPVYNCNKTIDIDNFDAGHIISLYNGGETDIHNLRPICHKCNISMSSRNWLDYEKYLKNKQFA